MNKLVGSMIIGGLLAMSPVMALADNSSQSAQVQALLAQIKTLQAQMAALQAAQAQVATASTNVSSSVQLIRNLKEGMSGDDIAALQTLLASDPTIFPNGNVNGVFGSSTREALKKFQRKHGIEALGFAGPKTLKKLNELFKDLGIKQTKKGDRDEDGDGNNDKEFCIKVPPGHLIAPGLFKTDDHGRKEGRNKFKVVDCDKNQGGNGNGGGTSATTTPAISNQASASVVVGGSIFDRATLSGGNTPTGTISFNVYGPWDASCSAAISPAPASVAVNGNAVYNSGSITATTTGTYKFISYYSGDTKNFAVSTNCGSAGNSVVVTALPDTTAPVISALGTSNLLGTTTSLVWNTNEAANSKVWYGTTTPVVTTGSANIVDNNFVTSHSVPLSGLATSTTYYFVVTGADASGNTATSTQGSFVTTAGL